MVNKKGWLRIVEAVISILIVFGAVLTVSMKAQSNKSGDICDALYPLLEEIAKNTSLRSEILNNQISGTKAFLEKHIKNPSIDLEVKICVLDDICPHNKMVDNVEVCASERVISSSIGNTEPKKLKVFLFNKK